MSSLAIYIIGFVLITGGLAYGAQLAHVPNQWIGVGVVVMLGLGVVMGVTRMRQRDPSHDST